MNWNPRRLPRADDKNVLVTGGNAGIGYFIAEQFAAAGAVVVLGCRDPSKAAVAGAAIRARVPGARIHHMQLDLADLASLQAAVDGMPLDCLDVAVLNAGIAIDDPPRRENTAGHELMLATNHLGHFALTHRLAPLLAAAPAARIVTMGSFAARSERLDLDDLQSTRSYQPKRTYGRSKLAQMIFAFELDRRLRAAGGDLISVLAHPGGALDSLTPARPGVHVRSRASYLRGLAGGLVLQGKDAGAWSAVRAALDPEVVGGQLWGPRVFGLRGQPRLEQPQQHMTDPETARQLWTASVELTGVDPVAAL
ncbi:MULTISPECIES: SDR family NAD(P)-dependent oxidoreductase [Glycomyces]|uniref:NAD(P)-dependent dehydrogenase (Short-subunit alcohol dehydrogenase family) n=2 Tax=Glycomyces TaxID=58113 RepID=A0A9X3T9F5_9ACTN|nr:SDR family NAD(P)-dependent oxidoreductase [Glycomyces lechevalierae]MDA1386428.1 SDR family NAD(P)-dependent oxidoreductase [Glycomyces lechevalierae]MDR7338944.1 NAD(P)-dependent dehydrogenase (short-subunit alcohol dehydrogenase family) [Glycomyces lechevalierae]